MMHANDTLSEIGNKIHHHTPKLEGSNLNDGILRRLILGPVAIVRLQATSTLRMWSHNPDKQTAGTPQQNMCRFGSDDLLFHVGLVIFRF